MKHAGPLEIEVKLRIPSTGAMAAALAQAGFSPVHPPALETNRLWDRAGALLAEGCALRLRQYGDQVLLTWKGARVADPRLKIRPELETAVADAAAMEGILGALGFCPVLTMVKTRAIWGRGGLEACLDDTPHGAFLELEGARDAIQEAMAELALDPGQIETRSYAELYAPGGMIRRAEPKAPSPHPVVEVAGNPCDRGVTGTTLTKHAYTGGDTMRESNGGSMTESLMLFLAGAAIGGLLVALNTPKTGAELREDIQGLGRRAKKKAEGLAEEAGGVWDRLKGKAGEAGEAVKEEMGEMSRR